MLELAAEGDLGPVRVRRERPQHLGVGVALDGVAEFGPRQGGPYGRRVGDCTVFQWTDPGHAVAEVFAPVAHDLIMAQLVPELRWATEHAPGEYAVLNACRAWQFAAEGTLVCRIDGGQWALHNLPTIDHELVQSALDHQRCLPAAKLDPREVTRFVHRILSRITEELA